jgi:hypothetical protein
MGTLASCSAFVIPVSSPRVTVNSSVDSKIHFCCNVQPTVFNILSVEKESCFESEHEFCYRVQTMAKSKIP